MQVELLQWSSEEIVRRAIARCHGKEIASEDMIQRVIQLGHESVLEHWFASFDIRGISRACLAQLTRHRIASYSVRSQRYCDESQTVAIIPDMPKHLQSRYAAAYRTAFGFYKELVEAGVSREDARFVLPEGTVTDLILTMNARELRHFFRLRLAPEAQWEIKELAGRMLELVREKAPNIFGNIKAEEV
ncbi:MAG: FAD-dependent thymidylate synthase [Firmicutes bacterium]|nr:FAD-dependent thymidylate synthase [Bacillota bacterium]